MLSINGPEFIVLVIIALVIIGPERLPHYAQQLGRTVRELRRMAQGARDQVKAELGDEFEDLDWQKLDPRQYDPRRIVKEALSDVWDDEPARPTGNGTKRAAAAGATAAGATAATAAAKARPVRNPAQRNSAGPRKRAGVAGAEALDLTKPATTKPATTATTGQGTAGPTTTKAAGRPGARPGGGASRPGDVTGPAPYDLEAT